MNENIFSYSVLSSFDKWSGSRIKDKPQNAKNILTSTSISLAVFANISAAIALSYSPLNMIRSIDFVDITIHPPVLW
ncbi:hypothetical protein D3C76_1543160 [compost metagenome]